MFCSSEFAFYTEIQAAKILISPPGAVTAIMTNPIWVVKVRMFTTRSDSPNAYRGVWRTFPCISSAGEMLTRLVDGFSSIVRSEGVLGLFRGTSLALFGVSNGALQFVVYERMKRWGFEMKKKQFALAGRPWTTEVDKLVSTSTYAHFVCSMQSVQHLLLSHVRRK